MHFHVACWPKVVRGSNVSRGRSRGRREGASVTDHGPNAAPRLPQRAGESVGSVWRYQEHRPGGQRREWGAAGGRRATVEARRRQGRAVGAPELPEQRAKLCGPCRASLLPAARGRAFLSAGLCVSPTRSHSSPQQTRSQWPRAGPSPTECEQK